MTPISSSGYPMIIYMHTPQQKFLRATHLPCGANCRDIFPSPWAVHQLVKKLFHFAASMQTLWNSLPDHERPSALPRELLLGSGGNGITFEHALMDRKYAVKWVSLEYWLSNWWREREREEAYWQQLYKINLLAKISRSDKFCMDNTVELLITDPPRSDHPLYNGQPLWNGLNLP